MVSPVDKIRAKIVKEGHEITLNRVMEIARPGSFHTTAFGENARDCKRWNYVQYGKSIQVQEGEETTV